MTPFAIFYPRICLGTLWKLPKVTTFSSLNVSRTLGLEARSALLLKISIILEISCAMNFFVNSCNYAYVNQRLAGIFVIWIILSYYFLFCFSWKSQIMDFSPLAQAIENQCNSLLYVRVGLSNCSVILKLLYSITYCIYSISQQTCLISQDDYAALNPSPFYGK